MIDEYRRLTFSMDELATAVLSYLIATKKMGERDKLAKIAIGGTTEDVNVSAVIQPADVPTPSELTLGSQLLAALLIAHCIKRKVPLPKRAAKAIVKSNNLIALVLTIQ
ncbi:MAG TPA: hypothetical protein VMT54_09555 [Candidatus Cybelea sp.]|nr:hypothetical protein [Candidatus Cybelea sp.]